MSEMTTRETVARRVNGELDRTKVTRAEILKKVSKDVGGLSRTGFSNYTSGRTDCPATVLKSLSQALKVSSDYLLGLTDIKNPNSNVRAICNATGLSETAVRNLSSLRGTPQGQVLNNLLENREVMNTLFNIFSGYRQEKIHMAKQTAYQKAEADFGNVSDQEAERVLEKLPVYFEDEQSDDNDNKKVHGLTKYDLQAIKKNSVSMELFSVCDRFCSEEAEIEFSKTYKEITDKIDDIVNDLRDDPDFQHDNDWGDYDDLP